LISPAMNKTLDAGGNLRNLHNTQMFGVRVGLRF
jgi:hypothetical protein